ncbi:MAG: hypothetical protein J0L75_08560 [Spirochaetes bacterium]|nr:hypothetical protein [Spirochaetota bacterium]
MALWKTVRFGGASAAPLLLCALVWSAPAPALLATLAGPDTNRIDAQLGFVYFQRTRNSALVDSGQLLGPEAFAFTRHGGFFASMRVLTEIEVTVLNSPVFSIPEFALGFGSSRWFARAGILHSRVGTPWADEWQASWRHGFLGPTMAQAALQHFPSARVSAEFRHRPAMHWEWGGGISYVPFDLVSDPLLPQLAVEGRYAPGEWLAKAAFSTHQFGRRQTSESPFLDRRVYTFLADLGWKWLALRNEFEFYLWSPEAGRWGDTHVVRLEPPLPRGFRLFAEAGVLAQNNWDPAGWNALLDLHVAWRRDHFQVFLEEHLALSLWNGLPVDHRLQIGILLNIERD